MLLLTTADSQQCQLGASQSSGMELEHHAAAMAAVLWHWLCQPEEQEWPDTTHINQGTEIAVEKELIEAKKYRIFAEQDWFHAANLKSHPTALIADLVSSFTCVLSHGFITEGLLQPSVYKGLQH